MEQNVEKRVSLHLEMQGAEERATLGYHASFLRGLHLRGCILAARGVFEPGFSRPCSNDDFEDKKKHLLPCCVGRGICLSLSVSLLHCCATYTNISTAPPMQTAACRIWLACMQLPSWALAPGQNVRAGRAAIVARSCAGVSNDIKANNRTHANLWLACAVDLHAAAFSDPSHPGKKWLCKSGSSTLVCTDERLEALFLGSNCLKETLMEPA